MIEGALMGKRQDKINVYELTQDREDTEGELLPHAVSAPSPNAEGGGSPSRTPANS